MYHSMQIIPDGYDIQKSNQKYNGKNTWDDWHLIPSTRPLFNPPAPKTNYIDIPGANGSIDMSTALSSSYPIFSDRTASQEFYVMNGHKEWYNAYSDIMNYCHGQNVIVILEDEPSYYYRGRVNVNAWKSEKDWSKITLDFTMDPFKYELFSSGERWKWDPFSFVDGIVTFETGSGQNIKTEYTDFTVSGGIVYKTVQVTAMPICPEFTITANEARTKIKINSYYKNSSGWNAVLNSPHEYELVDTDPKTFTYPDIILRDYRHRIHTSIEHAEMRISFEPQSGKTFTVTMNFRRGKL